MRVFLFLICAALLAGCESLGPAPVHERTPPAKPAGPVQKPLAVVQKVPAAQSDPQHHIVQKGDTLFAIAFQNGLDYRDLAFWNNIADPGLIKTGQVLRLIPPADEAGKSRGVETAPLRQNALDKPIPIKEPPLLTEPKGQLVPFADSAWAAMSAMPAARPVTVPAKEMPAEQKAAHPSETMTPAQPGKEEEWLWPAAGALSGKFGEGGGKGINITGERLSPIVAASSGKVVYSGAGLRGYGKMLIIKHEDEFLTAYAHNQTLLSKEGDWVKQGQKIAEMGDSDTTRVELHFEIRQFGKPMDPLRFLPERK